MTNKPTSSDVKTSEEIYDQYCHYEDCEGENCAYRNKKWIPLETYNNKMTHSQNKSS